MPCALVQEDPVSSEDFAKSDSDLTLHLAILGGQSSPADFGAAQATAGADSTRSLTGAGAAQETAGVGAEAGAAIGAGT